jgi:hypothetical protein
MEFPTLLEGGNVPTTPYDIRSRICTYEAMMFDGVTKGLIEPLDWDVQHVFTRGVYSRTMFIPKGSVIVGKIHKYEHLNFISLGRVTVLTEFDGLQEISAPYTTVSKAGTKRLLYAHEDTIWTTIHATEETDLEKIEQEHIAPSYTSLGLEEPILQLENTI